MLEVTVADIDAARLRAEKAELEAENAELRVLVRGGWWRRGAVVLAMTAIVAAAVPVTSGIQAYFETERQVVLQASEQAHAVQLEEQRQLETIRAVYLDPSRPRTEQLKALRLLAATGTPALRAWAEAELEAPVAEAALKASPTAPATAEAAQVAVPAPAPRPVELVRPPPPSPPPAVRREAVRPLKRHRPPPPREAKMALKDDPY